jgi:hypothetical protein
MFCSFYDFKAIKFHERDREIVKNWLKEMKNAKSSKKYGRIIKLILFGLLPYNNTV